MNFTIDDSEVMTLAEIDEANSDDNSYEEIRSQLVSLRIDESRSIFLGAAGTIFIKRVS